MEMKVRYINKVEVCAAQHLRSVLAFAPTGQAFTGGEYIPFRDLPLAGLAALEQASELQDGARIWTSRLTAVLRRPFVPPLRPVAFRLTMTDGTRLLMGLGGRPHPTADVQAQREAKAGGASALTLVAEWKGPFPVLEAVD